jgi:hypothetical protein
VVKIKKGIVLLLLIYTAFALFYDSTVIYLGHGFRYFEEVGFIEAKDTSVSDIPPSVLAYKNRWTYLLVKQKPKAYDDALFAHFDYSHGRDTTYYWLINKKTKHVWGPEVYSEMEHRIKEMQNEKLSKLLESLK